MNKLTDQFYEVTKDEVPTITETKKRNRTGKKTEVEDDGEDVEAVQNSPKRGCTTKGTKGEAKKDGKEKITTKGAKSEAKKDGTDKRTHQTRAAAPEPRQGYLSAVADPFDESRANETFADASRRQALEEAGEGEEDSEFEDESKPEDESNPEDDGDGVRGAGQAHDTGSMSG